MAIASAVERNGFVYVSDERGSTLATLPGGDRPGDGLQGYTSTTVSIKRNGFVYVYNERGSTINTIPA